MKSNESSKTPRYRIIPKGLIGWQVQYLSQYHFELAKRGQPVEAYWNNCVMPEGIYRLEDTKEFLKRKIQKDLDDERAAERVQNRTLYKGYDEFGNQLYDNEFEFRNKV